MASVTGAELASPVCARYRKRIAKYGARLFTFLEYDGVPWNNNNAEHAIKGFAKYRRFADGRFTEASIGDFLVMLSVCQTARYQNMDVLKFLLSQGPNGLDLQGARGRDQSHVYGRGQGFGNRPEEIAVLDHIRALRRRRRKGRRIAYEEIAEMLNGEGILTRKGGKWSGQTVRSVVERGGGLGR